LSPPAYAFALPHSGTQPLKFDPSVWIQGARPRFVLRRQIAAFLTNLLSNRQLLLAFGMATGVILMLGYFYRRGKDISMFRGSWPICVVGIAGCVMYALVYVESRYVAAFLVLFWCGIIFSLRVPQQISPKVVTVITLLVIAALLLPMGPLIYLRHMHGMGKINNDALAAAELESLGIQAGDQVACVCPIGSGHDLGFERIARVTVAAEVDLDRAAEFWSAPITTQRDLLQIFAARGVKAVIATSPKLDASNQSEWSRLGPTQYWVWLPDRQ
jgi:hypothetical protein